LTSLHRIGVQVPGKWKTRTRSATGHEDFHHLSGKCAGKPDLRDENPIISPFEAPEDTSRAHLETRCQRALQGIADVQRRHAVTKEKRRKTSLFRRSLEIAGEQMHKNQYEMSGKICLLWDSIGCPCEEDCPGIRQKNRDKRAQFLRNQPRGQIYFQAGNPEFSPDMPLFGERVHPDVTPAGRAT
jgi:hypothetical protein